MKIKRIAIVGGGTAGWMAANHLGAELSRDLDIEITLIESKDIPVIGVGEGTVPRIKPTLQKFGISELDLLLTCDATFKQGIKFSSWLDSSVHGEHNFYYHPFEPPYPNGYDLTSHWLSDKCSLDYAQLSEFYSVAENNKAPKQVSSPPYVGVVDYAYHFNAAKFSELLANNARKKYRVKHVYETIEKVCLGDDGSIKSLVFSDGKAQEFDFYVDCSGFSSLLMGQALSVGLVDKSRQILTNTALVLQEPTAENEEIIPYTLATAHSAGWIWDIPLTNRRGLGFVYAAEFMTDEAAAKSFSKYMGRELQVDRLRKVPMEIGYRELFWEKNCVALGLAQGFVEPLEATSILVTDFSANLLARNFPRMVEDIEVLSGYCNRAVAYIWERVIDFVQLHYVLSDRCDSDFWKESTKTENVSDVLKERLAIWKVNPPKKSDFFSRFDIFGPENYLYVLYGMGFATRSGNFGSADMVRAKELFLAAQQKSQRASEALLSHREWLNKLKHAVASARSH